jgi:hypothetical protein
MQKNEIENFVYISFIASTQGWKKRGQECNYVIILANCSFVFKKIFIILLFRSVTSQTTALIGTDAFKIIFITPDPILAQSFSV